ncbi:XRE family transcriptional regulator [Pigmentiphaga aceris]|uniref:XRE family transcriptional regulator n=1 Tax=Pigmentiphaga aceris TaxID=1940612 RepID=UPI001FE63183|nr:XRE family transcriptional regulator [Pigmentiphaga aceris]
MLPSPAASALRRLGADLALARKRRKEALKTWAIRMQVSVPTLMKMEKGDPTVSMGVYATAIWLINRHEALGELADPAHDKAALETEVRAAKARYQPKGKQDA